MSVKAAVLSYNQVAAGQSGWAENGGNAVLLVQGENEFAALQLGSSFDDLRRDGASLVDGLWPQLVSALPELDCVVVYVGSYGSERAIELLAEYGVPAERVVFVSCSCNQVQKRAAIERFGYDRSMVAPCGCGGRSAMQQIYAALLTNGALPF